MIFFSLALISVVSLFIYLYNVLFLKPERLRSKLQRQGIKGPTPSFLFGNIPELKRIQSKATKASREKPVVVTVHDCGSTLFPYLEQWRNEYGPIFMFSLGNVQLLHVTQPDVVKEISTCTSLDLGRPSYQFRNLGPLLGQGVVTSNGDKWAYQRKIIAPELYMGKVKGMINIMTESTVSLMESWRSTIERGGGIAADIRVDEDLTSFSADVISKACFGSSYSKGQQIFSRLRALQLLITKNGFVAGIPILRYVPTKSNRDIWRIEKEIKSLILKIVKERKEARFDKDLLQMILEGAKLSDLEPDRFIVDNCKNIYQAGHETVAFSAAWCLMLLASHPEWQARVRAEVFEVCRGQTPDFDMLPKMKTLTMVIQEVLRLYPSVAILSREAMQDMKFGDVHIPKGVNLWILVLTMHQDPEIWGADAHEFNPERFANGIAGSCKIPQVYMPFGVGPRTCLGQYFAMVELKILLSLILSIFSFSLSSEYRHSPTIRFVIEPEYGVNLLMRSL